MPLIKILSLFMHTQIVQTNTGHQWLSLKTKKPFSNVFFLEKEKNTAFERHESE